uniref:Solute carrier family 22 member 6, like n=1 Tax=Latimeria chalumnae TaxID=7897 RepID=H3BFY9_LATCH
MAFRDVLENVGSMGRFQIIHIVLLLMPTFWLSSHHVLQNFTGGLASHHCRVTVQANGTQYSNLTKELEEGDLLRVAIPMDSNQRLESCFQFTKMQWHFLNSNHTLANMTEVETEPCRDGWTYDKSIFSSTIVTEWDLVCNLRSFKPLGQSVYMGGVLVGAIMLGGLSDRFGRKKLLLWSYFQMGVTGTCAAFAPNFITYCVFRFLTGMAQSGITLNSFSLIVEWICTEKRTIIGTAASYCFTIGQLLLAGYAYGIRDWRWLQFATSVPFFIFFLYGCVFKSSESPIKKKKKKKKKQLESSIKKNLKKRLRKKKKKEILNSSMQQELASVKASYSILDLFRTPAMRRISCCLSVIWASTSFAYYGLALDLQNFGINIYLVQVIFGAIDIPAKFISTTTMSYVGRRFTQVCSLIIAGLMILANTLVPRDLQTLRTALAVLGKGSLASSFTCAFLYTGEIYPTVIRQTGIGFGSTMARVGAIAAPTVVMLGEYASFLPLVVYGGVPILASIAACFLPETRNTTLPDTIEQVERRAKGKALAKREEKSAGILLETTEAAEKKQAHDDL